MSVSSSKRQRGGNIRREDKISDIEWGRLTLHSSMVLLEGNSGYFLTIISNYVQILLLNYFAVELFVVLPVCLERCTLLHGKRTKTSYNT